jgi:hypothetical protein
MFYCNNMHRNSALKLIRRFYYINFANRQSSIIVTINKIPFFLVPSDRKHDEKHLNNMYYISINSGFIRHSIQRPSC